MTGALLVLFWGLIACLGGLSAWAFLQGFGGR